MTDTVDRATRSRIMGLVQGTNTKPERRVQEALRKLRVGFSTHAESVPGKPDIVIPRLKLAVFVNGCFWHWHGCKRSRMPAANREYWEQKIARNVRRDRRHRRALSAQGWHYCTIWECSLERGIARLARQIRALREAGKR